MKRLLITFMAALSLLLPSHALFAIEYCIDFLEYGNPGGWENSLKTCEQTIDCNHYYSYFMDVWLKDVPEPLVSAGFYLEYDPWAMSIVELNTYDGSDLSGPWDPGSIGVADPNGPGTYFLATANLGVDGAQPDAEGDIIIAQIEFECLGQGPFTISTVPDFDTVVAPSFTVYDPHIDPLALSLNGLHIDYDGDWLEDYMDNCYLRPNGPGRGSCTKGSIGNICLRHTDCGANGFCSMDQEDTDGDYAGDACDDDDDNDQVADAADNCPLIQNGPVRGTCYAWSGMSSACTSDNDCSGLEGSCSTDQEDLDSDIVGGICDNCPDEYNPDQEDLDRDKSGDICDPDDDGDGLCDPGESSSSCSGSDECPRDPDNDADNDSLCGDVDNCPAVPNVLQTDTRPPQSNGIGDACECEGNFNCSLDQDVDGSDAALFKADFGRSTFEHPCIAGDTCNGDFNCDGDVDGTDASLFKSDFGRSSMQNPCPACEAGEWCMY